MANNANGAHFIGNLTADPKVDMLPTGTKNVSFTIANNYYGGPNKPNAVNFFDIVTWGKLADVCETYLRKGKQVYVEGKMQQQIWKDNTTQQTRSRIFLNCNEMFMIGGKKDGEGREGSAATSEENHTANAPQTNDGGSTDDDESVPF